MENIKKTGILTWNKDNLDQISKTPGVYILRKTPINGGYLEIKAVSDLQTELMKIYENESNLDINFFEVYETINLEEAEKLVKEISLSK